LRLNCVLCLKKQGSDSSAAKDGQKTLAELDQYRYNEAPDQFGVANRKYLRKQEDLVTLMEWKLSVIPYPSYKLPRYWSN
jgi:hypothetical protein